MIRLLVVDDHELVRDAVIAAVSQTGDIEVVGSCADGEQAVEQAAATRPDVVLMDLSMPVLDGVEATRRIIAARPATRVVIFTAAIGGRAVADARAAGAVDCVSKLADLSTVIDSIRRAAPPRDVTESG